MDNINEKTIKKIGSIPLEYDEKDILFMKDNKIFIAKADKKIVSKKSSKSKEDDKK